MEDPIVLLDTENVDLAKVIKKYPSKYPGLDFQWIEDRFWIWVHYAALKIGRGEYLKPWTL